MNAILCGLARIVSGCRGRWTGCIPSRERRIYFANHTSHLDALVILASIPAEFRACCRVLAAADYWGVTALRRYLARVGLHAILIDREPTLAKTAGAEPRPVMADGMDPASRTAWTEPRPLGAEARVGRVHPLTEPLAALERGESLIIFPEGGRREGDCVREFRPGLWHLARKRPDVPLIPVYLENLNRVLPKGEIIPVPLISTVTFGAPLAGPVEAKADFLERARRAVADLRPVLC